MVTKILNLKYIHLTLSTSIVLGALICMFPPDFFLFKMSAKFAVQIMLSYLVLGLSFMVFKSYKLMFTSFACCAVLCLFLKYTTNSEMAPAEPNSEETIKIAHFIISASEDYDFIIDEVLRSDADLVSLQEITPNWNDVQKDSLNERYPYSKTVVKLETGLAVYSKYELSNVDTFTSGIATNIIGTITLENTGKDICFITSNTLPSFYSKDYRKLRKHLDRIADLSERAACPVLTIGDYGAVPWSTEIVNFRSVSSLSDSRRGFFPNSNGHFSIFQLPSDHIFYSNQLECIHFEDMEDPVVGHIGVKGAYQFNPNHSSL